jgi:hypothetical protein
MSNHCYSRCAGAILCSVCFSCVEAETWDVSIRHGTIIDGTGRADFPVMAIKDGHIARITMWRDWQKQELMPVDW